MSDHWKYHPCMERLEEMTPTNKGKFCDLCDREVMDLTGASEEEIEQYSGRGECVELTREQFDSLKYIHPLKRFAAAAFLVFGSSLFTINEVHGQRSRDYIPIVSEDSINQLSGTVVDRKSGHILPEYHLEIEVGDSISTLITNNKGEFQYSVPSHVKEVILYYHDRRGRHAKSVKIAGAKNVGKIRIARYRYPKFVGKF